MDGIFLDESTDVAEVKRLRREIEAVLKPWYNSEIPPPWSDEEILVMCVCMRPNQNRRGIAEWLFLNFKWCRRGSRSLVSWVAGFDTVLWLPKSLVRYSETSWNSLSSPYALTNVRAVRMFLHRRLWAGRDCVSTSKKDLFTMFPPELRTMIFGMLLVFPGCEVIDSPSDGQLCIRPRSDISTAKLDHDGQMRLHGDAEHNAHIPRTSLLAPLQVNKQFYNEKVPLFYAKNVFAGLNIQKLYGFLQHLTHDRRNCIRHLNCGYDPEVSHERYKATRYFKLMKDMQGLRSLSINLLEPFSNLCSSPLKMPPWVRETLKVPGIHSLPNPARGSQNFRRLPSIPSIPCTNGEA
jgi:hypothetical protein